jgi:hypothetical protein
MADQIKDLWPDPPESLRERLEHFVDSWPDVPDQTVVVMATSGVYGIGVLTGLTMGDIRTLASREAQPAETVVYGPEAERLGRRLQARLRQEGGDRGSTGTYPEGRQGP